MKKYFFLLLLALICINQYSYSENTFSKTKSYSMSDGLSHYGVTSILEDHNGLLWLGTFDGLNCFNGFDFKIFRNTGEVESITNNRVRSLYQDKNNNIWVGTERGISLYNYQDQIFQTLYEAESAEVHINGTTINHIFKYQNQIICVSEHNGLYFFDEETYELKKFITIESQKKNGFYYYGLVQLDHHLIISTIDGVIIYNLEKDTYREIKLEGLKNTRGITITPDKKHVFIVGNSGIYKYEINENSEDILSFSDKYFTKNRFRSIYCAQDNQLYLGHISTGLDVIDDYHELQKEVRLSKYKNKVSLPLDRVSVYALNKESGDWIASFTEGIYHINNRSQDFSNFKIPNNQKQRFPKKSQVLSINQFDQNTLLFNVNFRGVYCYDIAQNQFCGLENRLKNFDTNQVNNLYLDNEDNKWIKSIYNYGHIYFQEKHSDKWLKIHDSRFPFLDKLNIKSVAKDRFGYYWLATNEGLFRLEIKNNTLIDAQELKKFKQQTKNLSSEMRYMYLDPLVDVVWVGTRLNGLIRIQNKDLPLDALETQQYVHSSKDPNSISSNHITSIIRLPNKELWVGTERGGVCRVTKDASTYRFKSFREKEGLDNNVVKSILSDKNNNLWISTNKGLNVLNTKTFVIRTFSKEDGMLVAPFENTSTLLEDGKMVFGGANGFCIFHPDSISEESYPKLRLGELKIYNQEVQPNKSVSDHIILTQNLNSTDHFSLNYDQNVFSIEMLSLHYSNPKSHLLKYRLLPIEKEWVEVTSDLKTASFNSLPPGNYTFEVATSNSNKDYGKIKSISIEIKPPYWKTVWAYIIYVILGVVLIGITIKFLLHLTGLKHQLQIEQLEYNRLEELNKTKQQMFMNISHEFRTPLTLISGPIQVLLKMFSSHKEAFEHLDLINRQSKKMYQLVNQVQDFNKAEQSLLKLQLKSFDLIELLANVKEDFDPLAKKQNKVFRLKGEANKIFINADYDKLEIVLNNLLNNAFKFTQEKDSITMEYSSNADGIDLYITDSGQGISEEDVPFIFDRFYQSKTNTSNIGSGIGLAFSKKLVDLHFGTIKVSINDKEGTTFHVFIPTKVSKESQFNEVRLSQLLEEESHEERQKLLPDNLALPEIKIDENLKDQTVFFVEDNPDLREFVQSVLSDHFNIKAFENGRKCLDYLEKEWPDLLLSDILMPELNGLELCNSLKLDIRTSHIPVILLTSKSSVEDKISGLEIGADAYITKPFDMKHLITSIQMLLKNRLLLRERFKIDVPIELERKSNDKNDKIFIDKLYQLMEDNYSNEELDINFFAKELYLNRTHFYQKVKAITNHTPLELLRMFRLKKAAELLVQEKIPVSEVYLLTGFKSRTHFTKMFKDTYGLTPGKYGKSTKA
ncbi:hybrid sensor histidine kinase/response regulator transcription factor [Flammeovirga pacifica]|nr:response regulator [Flammeovirga pacifica]